MSALRLALLIVVAACSGSTASKGDEPSAVDTDTDTIPEDTGSGDGCLGDRALEPGQVLTTGGVLAGTETDQGWAFLGVPYAEPPVGPERLRPPQPYACRPGEVVAASSLPPVCPQVDEESGAFEGEEDCLQLNVWTTGLEAGAARPVLVFIHGGGNVAGSTSEGSDYGLYDGARLAAHNDAVVVTLQYRVGALGFLAHAGVAEAAGTTPGNLGLRDQQLALRWVQDNIAAFGGDPERVLLFGESAGAVNTCMQLGSAGAAGLFSAALIQSGACTARPLDDALAEGDAHVEALGCDGADDDDVLACLQALPVEDIAQLSGDPISAAGIPDSPFGPTIDGDVLVEDPDDAIEAGRHNAVPVVLGSNSDEASQWVPLAVTEAQYTAMVELYMGALADRVLELYSVEEYGSARKAWIALVSDISFSCNARRLAQRLSESQDAPVWRYWFSKVPTGVSGQLYGAWHGLELVYVFQAIDGISDLNDYTPDAADFAIEATMGSAWGSLAATGDPNGDLPVSWPAYSSDSEQVLELGDKIAVIDAPRAEMCDFWAPFY